MVSGSPQAYSVNSRRPRAIVRGLSYDEAFPRRVQYYSDEIHVPCKYSLYLFSNNLYIHGIQLNKHFRQTHDRAQRRLVKNSFIVELSDGHRKLRHLFLFNDVIACAKYKASGRDKFTFELKWYVPLGEALVSEDSGEPREASPANVVALRYTTAFQYLDPALIACLTTKGRNMFFFLASAS